MSDQKYESPYPPLSGVGMQPPIATAPPQLNIPTLPVPDVDTNVFRLIKVRFANNNAVFYACNGIGVLRNFVENQARADPQTAENTLRKYISALLQVQEERLHQIFNGGGTEVQNFCEHAFCGWSPPNMTYPPGLEYLMGLDYLFVNQKIELLQAFTGWETKNKYVIMDNRSEPVFYMAEESGICARLCLGKYRSCEFTIYDKNRQEVLRMVRPLKCDGCCCPCCLQVLEVYSGTTLLGSVTQEWTFWRPKFYVRDASGQAVLMIKGPLIRFCVDVAFKIKSLDEKHRVGMIRKQWGGFARELLTVSDNFGINFPRDLDVKIKAVLLGAAILIDFMYFEQEP